MDLSPKLATFPENPPGVFPFRYSINFTLCLTLCLVGCKVEGDTFGSMFLLMLVEGSTVVYSNEDIESAVEAGVLSKEDAVAFRDHVAGLRKTPTVDDENFKLITGFNDVFVVIASILLLVAVAWLGSEIDRWVGPFLLSVTAWLLAEYFTRLRGMALPSIVLLLAFVGGVLMTGTKALGMFEMREQLQLGIPSGLAAIAAWCHWVRFRVPITVAAGTATFVAFVVMLLLAMVPGIKEWVNAIIFLAGMLVFGLAMWWDSSDTLRQTRKSDVAFWLHLVAAPMLVHPVFSSLHVFEGKTEPWQAGVVAVLYVIIAFVSITIDRRLSWFRR